jgi:hypothetical protein
MSSTIRTFADTVGQLQNPLQVRDLGTRCGPDEFLEIYQTATPKLPAFFVACVSNTGDILPFVTIEASYRPA